MTTTLINFTIGFTSSLIGFWTGYHTGNKLNTHQTQKTQQHTE